VNGVAGRPGRESLLFRGCFAGARIECNRPLSGFPSQDWHDHQVAAYFVDAQTLSLSGDLLPSEHWGLNLSLPEKIGVRAWMGNRGEWFAIAEPDGSGEHNAWLVRRVLPFAASLQGFLTLHASSVVINGAAHAFIGESGRGKSTMAAQLKMLGFGRIADDQLPVRRRADSFVSVLQPSESGLPPQEISIRSLCFLERTTRLKSVERQAMSPASMLTTLLGEGFSELEDRGAWRQQFLAYEALARHVRGYKLIIPDDASGAPEFARQTAALIGSVSEGAESGT
jgi:hypothetical protein